MSKEELSLLKSTIEKEKELTTISFVHFSKMYKMYSEISEQLNRPGFKTADMISITSRRMTFLEIELTEYQKKMREAISPQ